MLNLDTNIIIEGLIGELSKRELELLEDESIAISDIVLWEISKLIQNKRVELDIDCSAFRKLLARLTVFPITLEIARRSTELDFQSDPADEIIAATSIVEGIPLLTRDRKILKSSIVPLAS
jgi:PIN domain nuclease of toxin-antitoxin system